MDPRVVDSSLIGGKIRRMASGAPHRRYTIEQYVELEEYANVKHEFLEGQIYAMAGGTPEHGTYAANVIGLLTAQLSQKPSRVQSADVRIRVRATGLDTYPDISVVCGRAERDSKDTNAIVNPKLLVEVTSPSTAAYDRGDKLEHYKRIPALVVFVAHDAVRIDVVRRRDDGTWTTLSAGPGGSLRLESVGCDLPVDGVYRDPLAD